MRTEDLMHRSTPFTIICQLADCVGSSKPMAQWSCLSSHKRIQDLGQSGIGPLTRMARQSMPHSPPSLLWEQMSLWFENEFWFSTTTTTFSMSFFGQGAVGGSAPVVHPYKQTDNWHVPARTIWIAVLLPGPRRRRRRRPLWGLGYDDDSSTNNTATQQGPLGSLFEVEETEWYPPRRLALAPALLPRQQHPPRYCTGGVVPWAFRGSQWRPWPSWMCGPLDQFGSGTSPSWTTGILLLLDRWNGSSSS